MPTTSDKAIAAATKKLRGSRVIPNTLSSNELSGISTEIRQQAVFSAKVAKVETLGRIRRLALDVVTGVKKPEEARQALQKYIKRGRYKPPVGKKGTIEDLSSDARTDLIIRTNVGLARGYGRKVAAQENMGRRPWWELYRQSARVVPRDWKLRWRLNGGRVRKGRMVAPINAPIWTGLSRFGTPYPPFDFNSGMGIKSLSNAQGEEVGLPTPKAQAKQPPAAFAPVRKATLLVDDPDLRAALLGSLNNGEFDQHYVIDPGGVLTQGTRSAPVQPPRLTSPVTSPTLKEAIKVDFGTGKQAHKLVAEITPAVAEELVKIGVGQGTIDAALAEASRDIEIKFATEQMQSVAQELVTSGRPDLAAVLGGAIGAVIVGHLEATRKQREAVNQLVLDLTKLLGDQDLPKEARAQIQVRLDRAKEVQRKIK